MLNDQDNARKWSSLYEEAQQLSSASEGLYSKLLKRITPERYGEATFLNSGAMKEVFVREDSHTQREIAFATLNESKEEYRESFLREAVLTASLEHPNIIPIYDIGLDETGRPYFTMKLIRGDDLCHIVANLKNDDKKSQVKYPLPVLLDIFLKVCEAMVFAHAKGVLHLDLKPANVRISSHGEVHIVDWGLAKIKDFDMDEEKILFDNPAFLTADLDNKTLLGQVKGTPGYMSPEQATASCVKNEKSDIYSLGAMLFSMLYYKSPVTAETVDEIISKTAAGQVEGSLKGAPPALKAIALKALATEPEQRYESVAALIGDINAYREGYAPQAEAAGAIKRSQLFLRRHSSMALLALLAAVVAVILLILSNWFIQKNNRTLAEAKFKAEKNLADYLRIEVEKNVYSKELSRRFLNQAIAAFRSFQFDRSVEFSRLSYELTQDNQKVLGLLVMQACIDFRIEDAMTYHRQMKAPRTQLGELLAVTRTLTANLASVPKLRRQYLLSFIKVIAPSQDKEVLHYFIKRFLEEEIDLGKKLDLALKFLELLNPQVQTWKPKQQLIGKLIDLDLSGHAKLSNTLALMYLPLRKLNLSHTAVQTFEHLPDNLRYLNLSYTPLTSLIDLRHSMLRSLDISHTYINDLGPIEASSLKFLYLNGLKIHRLENLTLFKNLEKVFLDRIPADIPQKLLSLIEIR